MTGAAGGKEKADLVIAGGGVVGLWLARKAARAGLKTVLCDAARPGAGASGGFLGALMPHMPERWNPKKRFQFEALVALEHEVRALEQETGLSTGYRRVGRLLPLHEDRQRALADERARYAADVWQSGETGLSWTVEDRPPHEDWPASRAAPFGVVRETLTGRIDPRALVGALLASLADDPLVEIVENDAVVGWREGQAELRSGRLILAEKLAVAAGHASFPLLENLWGLPPGLGKPVKGQAAMVEAPVPEDWPLIFHDGVYIVPHAGGRVAIGSTSEDDFTDPFSTDAQLDAVLARAVALCPLLEGAPVVERWAGLRPKAIGRDPLIGTMPSHPDVVALTGGFKITLGIAHKLADAALEIIMIGDSGDLPQSFRPEAHAERLARKSD